MRSLASELRPIAADLAASPRVYADANLPLGVIGYMRQTLGWDVLFVLEDPDFRRAADIEHYRRARDLGRTLITLDHDFLDDRRFPPSEGPGVVICSAPDEDGLKRLMKELDRSVFRKEPFIELPLQGRKLELTPDCEPGS